MFIVAKYHYSRTNSYACLEASKKRQIKKILRMQKETFYMLYTEIYASLEEAPGILVLAVLWQKHLLLIPFFIPIDDLNIPAPQSAPHLSKCYSKAESMSQQQQADQWHPEEEKSTLDPNTHRNRFTLTCKCLTTFTRLAFQLIDLALCFLPRWSQIFSWL